jgi:hypothetical protein
MKTAVGILALALLPSQAAVQFEFSKQVVQESDGQVTVNVVRVNDSLLAPFTVDFTTVGLSATSGADFPPTQGTISFSAGETVQTITIPVAKDGEVEPEERFNLRLSNPSLGVQLGSKSVCTIIIMDSTGMVPHQIADVAVTPNHQVLLSLAGGVSPQFHPFLDLYPIESSTNLTDWSFLAAVVKTNSATEPLLLSNLLSAKDSQRYYRTPLTNLVTVFPAPTGPYPVGTFTRILSDSSRVNRYGIATNASFMATFWFPAAPKAGDYPNLLFKDNLSKVFATTSADARRTYFRCLQFAGRSLATNESSYPIVIYSCGGGAYRQDNTLLALELASHGFIVVSADHEDLSLAELPDGQIVSGKLPEDSVPTYKSRFQDVQILLAALETMNGSDPVLRRGLDLSHIGVCGWSTGGVCAAQLCLEEDRIKVGVLLDPGLIQYVPHLATAGITKPFLVITGELEDGMQLYRKAVGPAYWLHISGSVHLNMAIPPVVNDGGPSTRRLQQVLQVYALSMLQRYLGQKDDHRLDAPSSDFPEVKSISRKNS